MIFEMLSSLFAGLGLFFIGIKFIGNHLKQMSGRGFRTLVAQAVKRPWQSAMLGVMSGALTQSTNAVTFVMTSMNAAGLISVRKAMPIVIWANVGTSALVLVATADIHVAVLVLLGAVGLGYYFNIDKSASLRHLTGAMLGIALLFLGLQFIKSGAAPLRDLEDVRQLLGMLGRHMVLLFLAGALITMVLQSSSTVSVIAVAMTHIGLLTMAQTVVIIYGAGLGSAASLWFMTANLKGVGRQLALLQIALKVVATIAMVMLLAIELALHVPLTLALVAHMSGSLALQAAWVFLFYQVVGALIITLAGRWLPDWLTHWSPPSVQELMSKPHYIYDQALNDAETALDLVEKEQSRLLGHLPAYLSGVDVSLPMSSAQTPVPSATTLHSADRAVAGKVAEFITELVNGQQDRAALDRMLNLQARHRLLDDLREGLVQMDECLVRTSRMEAPESPTQGVVERLSEAMHFLLLTLQDAVESRDAVDLDLLQELTADRSDTMDGLRKKALQQASAVSQSTLESLFSATTLFERLVWIVRSYSQLLQPRAAA